MTGNKRKPPHLSLATDSAADKPHCFSQNCLQKSFNLLRDPHPALALVLQNHLAESRIHRPRNKDEKLVAFDANAQLVSDIVTALSTIAEDAASSGEYDLEEKMSIHQVLLDWLLYAKSYLDDANSGAPGDTDEATPEA